MLCNEAARCKSLRSRQQRSNLAVYARTRGIYSASHSCDRIKRLALRSALKMPFRLATSLGRNEARWRNGKGSAIEIAGATALYIFFWRQVAQFDRQFLLGRFLFRHLDRSLDIWASWELDVPPETIQRLLGFTREIQGKNAPLPKCNYLASRLFGGNRSGSRAAGLRLIP